MFFFVIITIIIVILIEIIYIPYILDQTLFKSSLVWLSSQRYFKLKPFTQQCSAHCLRIYFISNYFDFLFNYTFFIEFSGKVCKKILLGYLLKNYQILLALLCTLFVLFTVAKLVYFKAIEKILGQQKQRSINLSFAINSANLF